MCATFKILTIVSYGIKIKYVQKNKEFVRERA